MEKATPNTARDSIGSSVAAIASSMEVNPRVAIAFTGGRSRYALWKYCMAGYVVL
jgi:hypothetical protein